ncbi:MAG: hypothetical protein ACOX4K_03110 [Bacillota bacterium]
MDVAYMAGLPFEVVSRAREILHGLETETRKGSGSRKGILGSVASRSTGSLAVSGISGTAPLVWIFKPRTTRILSGRVQRSNIRSPSTGHKSYNASSSIRDLVFL